MSKKITIPALARVEGEGGLYIELDGERVSDLRLDIYEPPRFFEGFLRGRFLQEVPDITARICGICPVAYQMSSVRALENALGVEASPGVRALRRLLYCAEYIESHALHIFMLQAPDLLGHDSALDLAEVDPDLVKNALRLKKIGNQLLAVIGGRSVHPVNVCVGGFYRWPSVARIKDLLTEFHWALDFAIANARWALALPFPNLEQDYEFVALAHPEEYAILEGEVHSSDQGPVPLEDFERTYPEKQVRHSNALHSTTAQGQPYLVGPLARLNNNHTRLGKSASEVIAEARLELPVRNPYKALAVRAIELVEVLESAIELIEAYEPEGESRQELTLKAGQGFAVTEAPRGLLYHHYKVDKNGFIETARIIPPTAQNLARIEADLRALVPGIIDRLQQDATLDCEHLIRAYDPCISCATHFLKLTVERK